MGGSLSERGTSEGRTERAQEVEASKRNGIATDAVPFSRGALQELMWADAGLVRDAEGLGHAASVIASWRAQARPAATVHDLEDDDLLLVAEHVVAAAQARHESAGAHYRTDSASIASTATRTDAVPARSRISRQHVAGLLHTAKTGEVA